MTKKDQTSIYFSGKRLDNGEWVTGDLLGKGVIIPCGQEFELTGGHMYGDLEAHEVDPETISPTIHARGRERKKEAALKNIETDILKQLDVLLGDALREMSARECTATVTLTLTMSSKRTVPWAAKCSWHCMSTIIHEKGERV